MMMSPLLSGGLSTSPSLALEGGPRQMFRTEKQPLKTREPPLFPCPVSGVSGLCVEGLGAVSVPWEGLAPLQEVPRGVLGVCE
jgi:hypothetical protein